jgi:septal ring factor EnvC (AmiA/AmiB activator)
MPAMTVIEPNVTIDTMPQGGVVAFVHLNDRIRSITGTDIASLENGLVKVAIGEFAMPQPIAMKWAQSLVAQKTQTAHDAVTMPSQVAAAQAQAKAANDEVALAHQQIANLTVELAGQKAQNAALTENVKSLMAGEQQDKQQIAQLMNALSIAQQGEQHPR